MELDWYKCKGDVWCELGKVDLDHKYLNGLDGVYVIWSGTTARNILRVGYGKIQNELTLLRKDLSLKAFNHLGLYVTWAELSGLRTKGVVSFLHEVLQPKLSSFDAKAVKVKVNLPWE